MSEQCDDCGGYDFEWMNHCSKHNAEFCRGCSCPDCAEENGEYDERGDDDFDPMAVYGEER